mmetsp:Transcript_18829/g.30757  ORF Transcript_18829/g.30757 Transcript_18829/m.30757 type:complete len:80 (+) Transcript_18829:560-799(+)
MNESAAGGGGDEMGHLDQMGQEHEFDDANVNFGTTDDGNEISLEQTLTEESDLTSLHEEAEAQAIKITQLESSVESLTA